MIEEPIKQFAKKWRVEEPTVLTIFTMVRDQGRRYGRVSRFLKTVNISLSPRQLKYFYHRITLYERMDVKEKGYPANYSSLLRKEKLHWE